MNFRNEKSKCNKYSGRRSLTPRIAMLRQAQHSGYFENRKWSIPFGCSSLASE